jgi:hypothetical protein
VSRRASSLRGPRDLLGSGASQVSAQGPLLLVALLGLTSIVVVVTGGLWTFANTSYDVSGAVIIAPILLLLTLPLARHVARIDDDPLMVRIIMLALVLKLFAAVVRYFVAFDVYGGSADAAVYIREGTLYAQQIRDGVFAYDATSGGSSGTHFIRQVTGYIFAITGSTAVGGFLVFAWMSFWGLYFFYRAFRIAVPDGLHRRYAGLLFFLPSLLYWPSSIGKEAWMLLTLGLSAFGVARLLTHQPGGYPALALGLIGSAMVRPHMTVLLGAGLAASFLLRRPATPSMARSLGKLVGLLAIAVAMSFAVQAAEQRFGVEGEGLAGAETVLDQTAEQTNQGGSQFDAGRPTSIVDVPLAMFSVLFRPLPHEAHNAQALLTSFEGLFLLVLCAVSWRRLRRILGECWRTPYVAFASVYSLLFMFAFSSFGNFGILARQRAQLFPLVLIVLALPIGSPRGTQEAAASPDETPEPRAASPLVVTTGVPADRTTGSSAPTDATTDGRSSTC